MKKKLTILLALVIAFSLCNSASAASVLSEKSAMASAVENVVTENYDNVTVSSATEWLPLQDPSGVEYAYLVPLKTGESISGYAVTCFVNGINRVLQTAVGPASSELVSAVIETINTNDNIRIVYDFPSAFLAEIDGSFYKICITGELDPVEIEAYSRVDAAFFENENSLTQASTQGVLREEIVYGKLDDNAVGDFIPIPRGNGEYYYGGYQDWLTDEGITQFYADRSCGVTAASNMMYYLATHVPGKAALYNQTGSLTKAKFNAFQRSVFNYLNPSIIGVPTLNSLINGVEEYAESRNVSLSPVRSSASWSLVTIRDYISAGLNSECPVLVLNWYSAIPDLNLHWVTVTSLYGDNITIYMVTSNWGEREVYDFPTWVNSGGINQGLIYFE